MKQRLFIISNRMPVTVEHHEGESSVRQSDGGLVTAITAYLNGTGAHRYSKVIWAGVPDVSEKVWKEHIDGTEGAFDYLPVFVNRRTYDRYYGGFANSVLWPLFHYFPSYVEYNEQHFDAYMDVNAAFARALSAQLHQNDVIWIHDYHLLPLAAMLRAHDPQLSIGFFLHIPFPAADLFQMMPRHWQKGLLKGVLGADLIGFHTSEYATHFLEALSIIPEAETDGSTVRYGNRSSRVAACPISIDYQKFHEAGDNAEVQAKQRYFRETAGNRKIIFSVDRLDYTKGIGNRLRGYEAFLKNNPEFRDQVVFFLTVVPSRDSITKYAERKKMIDEYIGSFNSEMGYIGWQPIVYQYGHLSFEELIALYTICDLALITPLRDGMNLVAKEFAASRKDGRGVLVLSEMAGAAKELNGALLINPNDTGEMAAMILKGLMMDPQEQEMRMKSMQQNIEAYDINTWSADFFDKLEQFRSEQLDNRQEPLGTMERLSLLEDYAAAGRRLFLLDYDGTLVNFCPDPSAACPGPKLMSLIRSLSSDERNTICIISGRERHFLEQWFGDMPVHLVAEHGALQKPPGGSWTLAATDQDTWKDDTCAIMERYNSICIGAFTERKEFSVAWHYRNVQSEEAQQKAEALVAELMRYKQSRDLRVMQGNKIVEVKTKEMNKGKAAAQVYSDQHYDFVLVMGDDVTDEDMFSAFAHVPHAYTIKIGEQASCARYRLYNPEMVNSLLETITNYRHRIKSVHRSGEG